MRSEIERHFPTKTSNHDQTNGKDQSHEPVIVPCLSHYSSAKSRLCLPGTITIIGSIKIYRCNPTLATSTSDNGMQSEALGPWRDAANGPGSSLKRESHVEIDGSLSRLPLAPPHFRHISTNRDHSFSGPASTQDSHS